ncbi:hypothetical protein HZ994_15280 [Akkermansiaceae bacterium]|nr:hypothetical protein HZ994_15280 [Akkermansiaceae bacterium]
MDTFAPGDRVVAINTDLSAPICGPPNPETHQFRFPDGPLRRDVIYHVKSVHSSRDGNQGLHITGLRVQWGSNGEIPWNSSRFRKVETLHTQAPKKRRLKVLEPILLATP